MNEFKKATMDNLYYNPEYGSDLDDECLICIDGGAITVKYDDDGDPVVWCGCEVAPGHYELHAPAVSGSATLHRFPDAGILVGDWLEDGRRGMWRIKLYRRSRILA